MPVQYSFSTPFLLTVRHPFLVTPPPEARPSAMHLTIQTVKPRVVAHLRALLAFASEVARNAVAEARWRRQRERQTESTYRASAVT
ncbi:MAG: hypothetical protein JWN96_2716 [Mycobacterium sp.]|nr:hypothetical protein [Mycobacterium sp.]